MNSFQVTLILTLLLLGAWEFACAKKDARRFKKMNEAKQSVVDAREHVKEVRSAGKNSRMAA